MNNFEFIITQIIAHPSNCWLNFIQWLAISKVTRKLHKFYHSAIYSRMIIAIRRRITCVGVGEIFNRNMWVVGESLLMCLYEEPEEICYWQKVDIWGKNDQAFTEFLSSQGWRLGEILNNGLEIVKNYYIGDGAKTHRICLHSDHYDVSTQSFDSLRWIGFNGLKFAVQGIDSLFTIKTKN